MIRFAPITLVSCLALVAASAQEVDLTTAIEQLASPSDHVRARSRLLALGAESAAPLAARWPTASDEHAIACLAVLADLGPAAGDAVPGLLERLGVGLERRRSPLALQLWTTLAELIPYRPDGCELSSKQRTAIYFPMDRADAETQSRFSVALARLNARREAPRGQALDALLATLDTDRRPFVIELTIERLGALGPAAARAVPSLRAVLDRPEPRVLPSDERVPLHRRAATALLQIAPGSPEAKAAASVLAGTWKPPAPASRPVPERARRRIEELVAELAQASTQHAAVIDNLVALGSLAAEPVAGLLAPGRHDATLAAALTVLRRLGKDAAATVRTLAIALTSLPAPHTGAVLRALATTSPWSEHVLIGPTMTVGGGRLDIDGHRIGGEIDTEFLNEVGSGLQDLHIAAIVPVQGDPELLRPLLAHAAVARRRRALEVIAARGAACVELLDAVGPMLAASQPLEQQVVHVDEQQTRMDRRDVTDEVQRLAAQAILAMAPTDHPLVAAARERLTRETAK